MTDYNQRVAKIINNELMDVYPPCPLKIIQALKDAGYHVVSTPKLEIREQKEGVHLHLGMEVDNQILDLVYALHEYALTYINTNYADHIMRVMIERMGEGFIRKLMMEDDWENRILTLVQERAKAHETQIF